MFFQKTPTSWKKNWVFKTLVTQPYIVKNIMVSNSKSPKIVGIVCHLEMVATKNNLKERWTKKALGMIYTPFLMHLKIHSFLHNVKINLLATATFYHP